MYILDQWFSAKNLKKIFDYEKRKWNNIDKIFSSDYESVTSISHKIRDFVKNRSEIYNDIKNKKKTKLNCDDLYLKVKEINGQIQELKEEKEDNILSILEKISSNINKDNFQISLEKKYNYKTKKYVFTSYNNHESFYCIKQLQYNIHKLYKVKQSDRFSIVNELKWLLDDNIPKKILRLDIKNFYENISFEKLLEKIEIDGLLSYFSKRLLNNINNSYKKLSKNKNWLPRGLWISAYLSELYMRDFDEKIKNLYWIYYYARYVDDIIVISKKDLDYTNEIKEELEKKWLLLHNSKDKYKCISYHKNQPFSIDYLWYNFKFESKKLSINLSENKLKRYKRKLDLTFHNFHYTTLNTKENKNIFLKRIRYLTSNVKLLGRKKHIKSGILYSNPLITNTDSLKKLDKYLREKTDKLVNFLENKWEKTAANFLEEKISKLSFEKWFQKNKFYLMKNKIYFKNHKWKEIKLKEDRFKKITKIWNYV